MTTTKTAPPQPTWELVSRLTVAVDQALAFVDPEFNGDEATESVDEIDVVRTDAIEQLQAAGIWKQ